jgi:hypothetical protein
VRLPAKSNFTDSDYEGSKQRDIILLTSLSFNMKGSLATIKNLLEIIKMMAITVTNMDWSLISNL